MITMLLLVIIYISFISLGLPDSLLGSAWPSMYSGMSVPISYAGGISVIISGGTVVSSILSERIIKRFGTGMVTAVSVLMTASALMGFSASGRFIALCGFAIPLGLGAGSVDAALNNYVALHYKARHMSWLHCFWGIGAATGPIIMSYCLMGTGSWQMGYRSIGIIQLCLTAMLMFSLPLWQKTGAVDLEREKEAGPSLTITGLLRLPGAKSALAAFFCYCALESTTGLWGGSYLVLKRGISPDTAAGWISLYYLGITFGRFLSGFLTVKLNPRPIVRIGQGIILGGAVLLILPLGNMVLPAGLFLIGLGCAPVFPSLLHETPENFGSEHSQGIMGAQMACAYIGSAAMPPLFGMIAGRAGYGLFAPYLILLLVVMVLMVEALNRQAGLKLDT